MSFACDSSPPSQWGQKGLTPREGGPREKARGGGRARQAEEGKEEEPRARRGPAGGGREGGGPFVQRRVNPWRRGVGAA